MDTVTTTTRWAMPSVCGCQLWPWCTHFVSVQAAEQWVTMEELMGSLASFYSQLPVFWDCLLIQNTWAAAPAQLGSFNPLKHQLSCWDLPLLRSGVKPRSHKTDGMLGLGALCRIAQCHMEVVCWCGALSCSFGVGRPKAASQHPHKSGVATHWAHEQPWSCSLPEDSASPTGY